MSDPLYGKPLLRLAADATGAGRLAQFDAETRFVARSEAGDPKRGLALLDKLDRTFAGKTPGLGKPKAH